jgi:hypothetical protein
MALCDCVAVRTDVKIRVDLSGQDSNGNHTAKHFLSPLCSDSLPRAVRFRSAEQRWIFLSDCYANGPG